MKSTKILLWCSLSAVVGMPTVSTAENTAIEWLVKDYYDDVQAQVGDIITFTYNAHHNLAIHPSGDCSEDGAILLGGREDSPVTYTFKPEDGGKRITFACNTGIHCESGQIIHVDVSPADPINNIMAKDTMSPSAAPNGSGDTDGPDGAESPDGPDGADSPDGPDAPGDEGPPTPPERREISIDWDVKEYDEMVAKAGDTVTFTYGTGNNVYIHPSGDCSEGGAIAVGDETESPASYTFTPKDAGTTVTFACNIGGRCDAGQIVQFVVADGPSDPIGKAAPTLRPSASPSKAPTTTSSATQAAVYAATTVALVVGFMISMVMAL